MLSQVKAFKTSDGKLIEDREEARKWQYMLNRTKVIEDFVQENYYRDIDEDVIRNLFVNNWEELNAKIAAANAETDKELV